MARKSRVGRPPKRPAQRKRDNLTIRVRGNLRAKLIAEADANQRSLSEETEQRLENSFSEAQVLGIPPLDDATLALLMMFARVIKHFGSYTGFFSTGRNEGSIEWISNPYAFQQVEEAVRTILLGLRPAGDVAVPTAGGREAEGVWLGLGRRLAVGVLEAVKNPDRGREISHWATPIRSKLGEIASRIQVEDSVVAVSDIRPAPNRPAAIADLSKKKGG